MLTRKYLRSIMIDGKGLSDEQIDEIISKHTDVVDGLKDELATATKDAEKLKTVQKELDDLKAKNGDDYKTRYEKEHNDFEAYKKSVADKETAAQKSAAVKAYFEGKGITGNNLEIAMRGAKEETDGIELADGKIKDTAKLDALISGTFKGLIVKTGTQGASTPTPPAGSGGSIKTRDEIYKKDDKGRFVLDAEQRQKALAELMASEEG